MTFLEFLKKEKMIDIDSLDMSELMERYYDEYRSYLDSNKEGCGNMADDKESG